MLSWLKRFIDAMIEAIRNEHSKPAIPPYPSPVRITDTIAQLLIATNADRRVARLKPLVLNMQLCDAAQGHADWMARVGHLSHVGKANSSFVDRILQAGYRVMMKGGENIAAGYGSPASVQDGWMSSRGHKANILGDYDDVGFGVTTSENGVIYWAANFAKPSKDAVAAGALELQLAGPLKPHVPLISYSLPETYSDYETSYGLCQVSPLKKNNSVPLYQKSNI